MIICDTSGLYAAYNAKQAEHERVITAIDCQPGPLIVSSYVLTELDYLMRTRMSVEAEMGMLRDVAAGAYKVVELDSAEYNEALGLIERFRERNLGLADAANVVLAKRYRTTNLLTLDERDYRIVRSSDGVAFTIIPADIG